jgi:hypothetical protein
MGAHARVGSRAIGNMDGHREGRCVDDVNNLRWLRDRWRAAARSSCYRTVVIYLNIPHTELAARRRANQVTAERQGITEAVWAEHVSVFDPPGATSFGMD